MRTRIPGIMQAVDGMTWAIMPTKLRALYEMLEMRAAGEARDPAFVAAAPKKATLAGGGKIAVIPLHGVVCQRANMVNDASGGTSTEQLGQQVEAAIGDSSISAVVLDVDSPGGAVDGVAELAAKLYGFRGTKPMVAVCNTLNASAAYWISSACDEMVATPSAQVGSIGVFTVRVDTSRANENAGIKYTVIKAGKYKADDLPFEPLSEDEEAAIQENVDDLYSMFVDAVAKHRGSSADAVRAGYGQGRVLNARRALAAKMIDRVATLDDTISRVAQATRSRAVTSGYAQVVPSTITVAPTSPSFSPAVTMAAGTIINNDRVVWAIAPKASTVNHEDDRSPTPANDPARSPVGDPQSTTPNQADDADAGDGYEPVACENCGAMTDPNGVCGYCGWVDPDGPSAPRDEEGGDQGGSGPVTTDPNNPAINPGDNMPDGAVHPRAGRAASGTDTTPASTASQAKERQMPETGTAAAGGAETETALEQIVALAQAHNRPMADVQRWVKAKASVEDVRREILADYTQAARPVGTPSVTNVIDREADRPFKSFGEQLVAVVQAGKPGGRMDRRLLAVNAKAAAAGATQYFAGTPSGMSEGVATDGGFFIQPELLPGVIDPIYNEDPFLSRLFRIPCGPDTNGVKYNVVDETSRVDGSRWGGIRMYWEGEADTAAAQKPKMRQNELNLKKLIGFAYLTEELTRDAPAAEALLTRAFTAETQYMLTEAYFQGTGVGQPMGILNSGAVLTQAIESGETKANQAQYLSLNLTKMKALIPAPLWKDMIWLYNQELLPYLMNATIGSSGTAVPVLTQIGGFSNEGLIDRILGAPAFPSEFCKQPGTIGDIWAVVPSQYHVLDKGGLSQDFSIHVRFLYFENTLRFMQRADGLPLWRVPVTPLNGQFQRSAYVNLNTRT